MDKYLAFKRSENAQVYKVLDIPHDLRPQIISWNSIEDNSLNSIQENPIQDVYSTIEAELQYEVGKQKHSNDEINEILANLADEGNDIKNKCK